MDTPVGLDSPFRMSFQTSEWDEDWSTVVTRRTGLRGLLATGIEDEWSSLWIFLTHAFIIFHTDMLLVLITAVGAPCLFHYYHPDGQDLVFNQSWTLISVLLVFPMTITMSSGFNRREAALVHIGSLRSNLLSILLAHIDWDWYSIPKEPPKLGTSGRSRVPPEHLQRLKHQMISLGRTLKSSLSAPTVTRARNYYTSAGRRERKVVMEHHKILAERMVYYTHNLSLLTEELKASGLPANEATRIRAFETTVMSSIQNLRLIKQYRTPLGLRAFSRIMIMLLPIMFGPYYAGMAAATGIAFTICFSVTCSLALLGLWNIRYQLEDPFISQTGGLDVIDITLELGEIENYIDIYLSRASTEKPLDAARSQDTAACAVHVSPKDVGGNPG